MPSPTSPGGARDVGPCEQTPPGSRATPEWLNQILEGRRRPASAPVPVHSHGAWGVARADVWDRVRPSYASFCGSRSADRAAQPIQAQGGDPARRPTLPARRFPSRSTNSPAKPSLPRRRANSWGAGPDRWPATAQHLEADRCERDGTTGPSAHLAADRQKPKPSHRSAIRGGFVRDAPPDIS
jgi:hypothetical protein